MKKFLFAFAAVFVFLLSGCSDSADNTNLTAVVAANNAVLPASTEVSEGKKTTVSIELVGSAVGLTSLNEDSRSVLPVFNTIYIYNIKWYVSLDGGEEYSELGQDSTETRYIFDVEADKEYESIKFKGECNENSYYNTDGASISCTVVYTAEMNNITFAVDFRKNVVKVPYKFDHVEMGKLDDETVDYYNTELKKSQYSDVSYKGLVAKVTINDFSSGEYSSVRLVKADDPDKILYTEDTGSPYTFKVSSDSRNTTFEPGIYNFKFYYNGMYDSDSYYIDELVFSDYDSLYLVKNNYVEAKYTPILSEEYYAETLYAAMDSDAEGDGKTPDSPISIDNAYAYCISEDSGLKTCNIYCGSDFALDWNALYADGTGILSGDSEETYKIKQNKIINVITPKAKYVIGRRNDDSEPCLRLCGQCIALKGKENAEREHSVFTVKQFFNSDYSSASLFGNWGNGSFLQLHLIDGAALMLNDYFSSNEYSEKINVILDDSDALNYYEGADKYFIAKVKDTQSDGCQFIVDDVKAQDVTVGYDQVDAENENYGYKLYLTH